MTYPALMYFDLQNGQHVFLWQDADLQWTHIRSPEPSLTFLEAAHQFGVWVFLPAECVLLRQVVMPPLGASELRQALPFALEEELIDEMEQLHFALAPPQSELAVSVAVITRAYMEQCLAFFKKYRLPVALLTSEIFLLPMEANSATLLLTENRYLLRPSSWLSFAGDASELTSFLPLLQQQIGAAVHCNVYSYIERPPELSFTSSTVHDLFPTYWLLERASSLNREAIQNTVNLLQGNYDYRVVSSSQKNRLRNISLLCVSAAVLILLFYPLIPAYFLSQRVADLRSETEKAYRAIFPDAKTVIAPKLRIEEKLAEYSSSAKKGSFLTLLAKLADAKSISPGIQLVKLEYQDNRMQLAIVAEGTSQLNTFVENVSGAGLKAKEQNTTVEGAKVKTNLELSLT